MAFNLAGLPAELRNLVIGHVAQLPAADLARASHVNKQWNANPLLLKAMSFSALPVLPPSTSWYAVARPRR